MDLYKFGKFWLLLAGVLFLISLIIIFLARKKSIKLSERATNLVMAIPVVILSVIILFTVIGLFNLRSKLIVRNIQIDSLTKLHSETTEKLNLANNNLKKTTAQRDSVEDAYVLTKHKLDSIMVLSISLEHQNVNLTSTAAYLHLQLDSLHVQYVGLHNSTIESKSAYDKLKAEALKMELSYNDSLKKTIARLIHANDSLILVSENQKKLSGNMRTGMDEETKGDNAKTAKDKFIHYSNALYYYRMAHIPTADTHYKKVNSYIKSHHL